MIEASFELALCIQLEQERFTRLVQLCKHQSFPILVLDIIDFDIRNVHIVEVVLIRFEVSACFAK